MNIIFIDDSIERHDIVEQHMSKAGYSVLHAYDADEGMQLFKMSQEPIALAMFDHDMGDGKSGSGLATEILSELSEDKYPARVIVHSHNESGAKNIASKFASADIFVERRPFSQKMIEQLIEELKPQ